MWGDRALHTYIKGGLQPARLRFLKHSFALNWEDVVTELVKHLPGKPGHSGLKPGCVPV